MKALLLIAVLVTQQSYALELLPGSEQTLTGTVSELQAYHTFYPVDSLPLFTLEPSRDG